MSWTPATPSFSSTWSKHVFNRASPVSSLDYDGGRTHPLVREAAVFGWFHRRYGEVAVAGVIVSADVTAKELQSFCAQELANYKVPYVIEMMDELPKNAMGKVSKVELKELIERKLIDRQAAQLKS